MEETRATEEWMMAKFSQQDILMTDMGAEIQKLKRHILNLSGRVKKIEPEVEDVYGKDTIDGASAR